MTLYLVRHGQTDWNLEKRFQANADSPLNETGRGQAQRARDELRRRNVTFTAARSSPLVRATETIEIILQGTATSWVSEPRLRELGLGDFEGCLESELQFRLGDDFEHWREQRFTVPAPNGETLSAACERSHHALRDLMHEAPTGNLLVVAHQAINMALASTIAQDSSPEALGRFSQANDEIDIWDTDAGQRIERVKIA